MNANDFYRLLYDHTHFEGRATRLLEIPTAEQYRTVLPDHNSIVWVLWHIARGEDWTVQTILQGEEQLLTREGWATQMQVAEPGFGGGMSRESMQDLTQVIDLDAMREYY